MNKETADYSAYRFLIADDKPFLRSMIQSMLVRCQAREIKHAADGTEAMKVLTDARGNIDCVLCDWNMEPVDGLELLRSIRAGTVRHTPRDMRFIMLTGHADEKVVKAAVAMDTSGYVVKPVSLEKLIRAIDNAFAKPVALKSEATYREKAVVALPDTVRAPVQRSPSWVLWSQVRKRGQEDLKRKVEQIQREGAALQAQGEEKRSIINKQRVTLKDIAPGKVLAEDIYAEDGALLLVSGTVLNKSLLGRLHELVAGSAEEAQLSIGDFA